MARARMFFVGAALALGIVSIGADALAQNAGAAGGAAAPVPDADGYFNHPVQPAPGEVVPPAAGAAGRRHTRQNALRLFYARLKFVAVIITTLLAVPQLVAICFVLGKYWNWNGCDHPIDIWLILLGVRLVCQTVLAYVVWCKPNMNRECQGFDSFLNIAQFMILILGMLWVMQSKTCPANRPEVYRCAWYLFLALVAILVLPMLAMLLVVPVALCCTPCLHNMLSYWFGERRGADDGVLAALTNEIYREGRFGIDKADAMCSICSESYVPGESIRVLPCPSNSHHFHQNCIDKWLKINSSCPICRHHIGPRREEEYAEHGPDHV